jgi:hypothetical protein
MTKHRSLGVKLIAAYLCMEAAVLIIAIVVALMRPELQPGASDFISHLEPYIQAFKVFSNRRMSLKEAKGRRSRVFVLSGFER